MHVCASGAASPLCSACRWHCCRRASRTPTSGRSRSRPTRASRRCRSRTSALGGAADSRTAGRRRPRSRLRSPSRRRRPRLRRRRCPRTRCGRPPRCTTVVHQPTVTAPQVQTPPVKPPPVHIKVASINGGRDLAAVRVLEDNVVRSKVVQQLQLTPLAVVGSPRGAAVVRGLARLAAGGDRDHGVRRGLPADAPRRRAAFRGAQRALAP